MKNYVQCSDNIKVIAPYILAAGAACLVGAALFGVAIDDAASGAEVVIVTKGVFDITALTTDTDVAGTKVYWDNTNKRVTTTSTSNVFIGVLVKAKVNGDTTARVYLAGPAA